jgi:hypothetical protein
VAPYNGDTAFLYQTKRVGFPIIVYSIEDNIAKGADYYVSVTKGDSDTVKFRSRFETIEEGSNYIILDLRKPL